MAIPVRQALGTAVSGIGAVTPAWPTHLTNDVEFLVCESAAEAVTLSTAAGFVEVTGSPQSNGVAGASNATRLTVFWCRATSAAMGSPTVADPGDHVVARIITIRGCITTGNPWDVTAGDNVAATTAVSIPGATTTVVDCLVLFLVANGSASNTNRLAGGFANTDLANVSAWSFTQVLDGNGGGFNSGTGEKATIGAYGATTGTLLASLAQGRLSLALKPPPPAGIITLTGTALASITEAGIRNGGKTINLTLSGDTFVASGATFDAQRQNIINGLVSAQSEAAGWNAVRSSIPVTAVVRNSATQVTVTLPALPTYNIRVRETITHTIPATAVVGSLAIIATPTFTIDPLNDGSLAQCVTTTQWTGTYVRPNGLGEKSYALNVPIIRALLDGIGPGSVDLLYGTPLAGTVLAASSSVSLDLDGPLADAIGDLLAFRSIKVLLLKAWPTNVNDVVVGNGTNPFLGWFGAGTDSTTVPPDGLLVKQYPTTGWIVTPATGDILKIANGGAGTSVTFDLFILGSSA